MPFVRLSSCILVELAAFGTLVGGTSSGVYLGGRELWRTAQARAYASQAGGDEPVWSPRGDERLGPLPRPGEIAPAPAGFGVFRGIRDEYLLSPLRHGAIRRVKVNHGGSSLSLRVDFEGGGRAAFKPDQTNLQTIPRKEVAAFRLNRLLGLSSVPPAVARGFSRTEIVAHLDPEELLHLPRLSAEMKERADGVVAGELSYWIPEIVDATIDGVPVDHPAGQALWARYLSAKEPVPAEAKDLLRQLSNMVAFDFLTNNVDRWSGSNAKASPDGRTLYFMDNTLAFGTERDGHEKCQSSLLRVQKFSRSFYAALKALDDRAVRAAMVSDAGPYQALLTVDEIDAMIARRGHLLAYVDGLVASFGDTDVLAFP